MKIYTRLEIDIESGAVLYEESLDYDGPVVECKGGGSTKVVTSAEERALYKTQNQLLQQQIAESEALSPILYRQLGLKAQTTQEENPAWAKWNAQSDIYKTIFHNQAPTQYLQKNTWVEMTPEEKLTAMDPSERASLEAEMLTKGLDVYGNKLSEEQMLERMLPSEATAYKANKLSNERYIQALKGELPISPALESDLADQENMMTETLSRKLGANWMLSTPGQKAYSTMKQKADLVREEARRGEIDSASDRMAQGMTTIQNMNTEKDNDLSFSKQTGQTLISNMANMPGRNTGTMSNASNLAGQYAQKSALQTSANQQKAANKAAQTQGYVQAGTTVAVAAAAAAAA